MFHVQLIPGTERLYRTADEFSAAMRNGEINADSRIFHRATSSWISITEHPEYRKFLEERHPPPRFDPAMPLEPFTLLTVPNEPGLLRTLAEKGAALATSSWASLKRRFDTIGTKRVSLLKSARSAIPTRPAAASRPAAAETPARPATPTKPETSAKPGKPRAAAKSAAPAKPAKSATPGKAAVPTLSPQTGQTAPRSPDSTRERWTFYP